MCMLCAQSVKDTLPPRWKEKQFAAPQVSVTAFFNLPASSPASAHNL